MAHEGGRNWIWAMSTDNMAQPVSVHVAEGGERIDRFLAQQQPDLSRAYIQKLIEEGLVTVNGRPVRASYRVRMDDHIVFSIPPPSPLAAQPEAIPLTIVYEDADVLVIDKPAGLVVHPAPGHASGTLVNAVLAHVPEMRAAGDDVIRPGIVHRLDKDTSGLLVVAKNDRALRFLSNQFKERTTEKTYLALLHGRLSPTQGAIDAPIDRDERYRQRMAVVASGRAAWTGYRVVRYLGAYTLVEAMPHTGRTHQIRVHFASIGHPVVGDSVYGPRRPIAGLSRQFLHATRLRLRLPSGEPHEFSSPLPADLVALLNQLE
jgi:23S rRNA pseudouridine1911/1915/1917 synthase